MEPNLETLRTFAETMARQAGKELLTLQGNVEVREKGPANFVTEADHRSETLLRKMVSEHYPDHDFLGEEFGMGENPTASEYCWLVDPLDGTTNYVQGIPHYCVSIALRQRETFLLGVVYDPNLDEMFSAARGLGATLNNKPIHTSKSHTMLSVAAVAGSFPPQVSEHGWEMTTLCRVLPHCCTFRRMGSAALTLAYIASGRLDAYFASGLHIWDYAAGIVLVAEAGGIATDIDGKPLCEQITSLIACGHRTLHTELHEIIAEAAPYEGEAG